MKKILFFSLTAMLIMAVALSGCGGGSGGGNNGNNNDDNNNDNDNNQEALFTRLLGGAGLATIGNDIAANASGIYITGETSGGLDGLTASGTKVAFLAKYDAFGNKQKTILYYGEPNTETIANAITADTSGVYITGRWSSGTSKAFIVKYDNSGKKLWDKCLVLYPEGLGIVSVSTGVYVTGSTAKWDSNKNTYIYNVFITKYNADGTDQWTQLIGSDNANTFVTAITVDHSGSYVYITGGTLDVLDGAKKGVEDFFVAKYDASTGELKWVKQLGGTETAKCNGVAITANSSGIYVISKCSNSTNFDGESCPSAGTQSFMVKFDPSGENHQTKFLGEGRSNFFVEDITSDSTGVYTVGDSSFQAFVAKYDFSGNEVGIKVLNSFPNASSYGYGITKSVSGIYITGETDGDLDGQTHLGTEDAFITNKLNF